MESIKKQKKLSIKITEINTFPNAIFAKIESKELMKLHKKLFKILPHSKDWFENNNYIPHITIGTLKENIHYTFTNKK